MARTRGSKWLSRKGFNKLRRTVLYAIFFGQSAFGQAQRHPEFSLAAAARPGSAARRSLTPWGRGGRNAVHPSWRRPFPRRSRAVEASAGGAVVCIVQVYVQLRDVVSCRRLASTIANGIAVFAAAGLALAHVALAAVGPALAHVALAAVECSLDADIRRLHVRRHAPSATSGADAEPQHVPH